MFVIRCYTEGAGTYGGGWIGTCSSGSFVAVLVRGGARMMRWVWIGEDGGEKLCVHVHMLVGRLIGKLCNGMGVESR
jgi:hypothetical protein